jgi:mannan endo-1,4-beta-mannosidase
MFALFEKLIPAQSSRMTTAVVGMSLAAVATSIYLSPAQHKAPALRQDAAHAFAAPQSSASQSSAPGTPTRSASPGASHSPSKYPHPSPSGSHSVDHVVTIKYLHDGATGSSTPSRYPQLTRTVYDTVSATPKIPHCSDFTWQQDAQLAYLANLSDPGGLDGAKGPHNGDGIACNELPVDPERAASIPVDAYTPPAVTAAQKTVLVQPAAKYFGVAEDGLPGDQGMLNRLAVQVGKAPSSLEWFSGFDSGFSAAQVTASWSRGALPVITWESMALDPTSGHSSSEYTLTHIVNGDLDSYLYQYAADLVHTGLPVVIRFDHEMNGNWYPWSAGMASFNNTPAKYIAAWQHIWQIFKQVGANQYAIWLWSPSRVDNLKPISNKKVTGQTNIADDYPGDGYVDWVGASAYLRTSSLGSSYAATFGKTVAALKAVTTKPIYIAETAAIQADSSGDLTGLKASWTTNAIAGFLADPQIIGFAWFNNDKSAMQDDGSQLLNNWRFDSAGPVLDAFKQAIAGPAVASGIMPDGS